MKDENDDPTLMLNVFAHTLKLHLANWNVQGDKTNEPGCLKKHLKELFEMYPCLKLLTGDAVYAQRPLLEALQDKEYAEDKHVLGRKSWGKTWTVLTNIAVSGTNLLHHGERTLREVREKCSHNPMKTAGKLGGKN